MIAAGEVETATQTVGILLILTAFSRGCAALTGVEAISDGVPAFQPPEWKNARATLTWMIVILAVTFAGITFLANQFGIVPREPDHPLGYETVVSQIASTIFGGGTPAYYYIQFATLAILILAANTAYSDFPRLSYFLARDRYLPKQFTFRGDRLAYSTGIVTLGILSSLMLAGFGGETTRMIPLYAVGVFTAFTLSQGGMVMRWLRLREPGWQSGLAINIVGVVTTGVVAVVVGLTNFTKGAWIVLLLIPLLIMMFRAIHRHYARAAGELAAQTPLESDEIEHTVIVPVAAVNRVARQTLAYARSISPNVTAVFITDDDAEIEQMRESWKALGSDIPMVIIESPYRSLVGPLLVLSRRDRPATSRRHPDRRPPRVHRPPLVGADPAQPDRPADQGGAPLPARHGRHQRAVPPGAARGVATIRYRKRSSAGVQRVGSTPAWSRAARSREPAAPGSPCRWNRPA